MDILPLAKLKPHQRGKVVKVSNGGEAYRRILDMGIIKGVEIEVQRVAPLGDPIEVRVRNYNLSMRKNEAENILVELIP